jgi:hypothetical protein
VPACCWQTASRSAGLGWSAPSTATPSCPSFGAKYDHVDDLRILRQAERHGQAASLYELDARTPHGAATFLMTEWNTVRDGRIESALLVFDTAAGVQLHAGGHAPDN